MDLCKYMPVASDRMGIIWTLSSIKDACIIEFGPAGTTHYALEVIGALNGEDLSNVYSTHISDTDIAFGKTDRLENSIKEVDINIKPKYIFVMASSISSIIGTDIESICKEIQDLVNAKLIPITTAGLKDDYNIGVEKALMLIAKNIVKKQDKVEGLYNIIGCNIDSYNFNADATEIKRIMKDIFSKKLNTVFTAYTSIERLENASKAQLNIVLRKEGLEAAKYMESEYGIPYIYKKPIGLTQTNSFIEEIKTLMNYEINEEVLEEENSEVKKYRQRMMFKTRMMEKIKVAIIGDEDTVVSMKQFIEELGLTVDRAEILHNSKLKDNNIIIRAKEIERMKYLKDNHLGLILADGVSLDMETHCKKSLQISNPNLSAITIYPYTPFVGFRGALLLIEKILSI